MIKKFKAINKAYKFRIYPNQEQQELIDKTIGCSRFIYNEFLAKAKKDNYKSYSKNSSQLPKLKKEYEWLKEVEGKIENMHEMIEFALELKFGLTSKPFAKDVKKIEDYEKLKEIKIAIKNYDSLDKLIKSIDI